MNDSIFTEKIDCIKYKGVWIWDVFGEGLCVVTTQKEVSWFRRFLTSLFLRSKWDRAK